MAWAGLDVRDLADASLCHASALLILSSSTALESKSYTSAPALTRFRKKHCNIENQVTGTVNTKSMRKEKAPLHWLVQLQAFLPPFSAFQEDLKPEHEQIETQN